MIYVSSACVKAQTIKESIEILVHHDIKNIELSGGTSYYEGIENDLLELQEKYQLNLLCHNYFPPPPSPFVLNIASLDEKVSELSTQHILKAIDLSKKLKSPKFGFHAGFIIDIPLEEIGKKIKRKQLFDRDKAFEQFCKNYRMIAEQANGDIELYVENNVLSQSNYDNYAPINPFFITDVETYKEFEPAINFTILLDVAHLKVSTNVLGKDFRKELQYLSKLTDYIHISDNDGWHDTNQHLSYNSELYQELQNISLQNKTITIEVYNGMDKVKESIKNVQKIIEYTK